MNEYTTLVQRDGRWWVEWLEEITGVSSQGESREELMENLRSAVAEALEMNRSELGNGKWRLKADEPC